MQRFLIRFFVTHPPAAVALGAVVLLGGAAGATWAYKRGKKLPQAPTAVTLSDVEAHANGNQWVQIDGAPILCERAVVPTRDVYVPLGKTPSGAYLVAFIGQRPCADLSAMPANGVLSWASEKRAGRNGGSMTADEFILEYETSWTWWTLRASSGSFPGSSPHSS